MESLRPDLGYRGGRQLGPGNGRLLAGLYGGGAGSIWVRLTSPPIALRGIDLARPHRQPVKPPAELRCASLDDLPIRYHRQRKEAWVCDGAWRRLAYAELFHGRLLMKRDFDQLFPRLPVVPKDAFHGRG